MALFHSQTRRHMITPFFKIDKPLVVQIIVTLSNDAHNNIAYIWQNAEVFTPKMRLQKKP